MGIPTDQPFEVEKEIRYQTRPGYTPNLPVDIQLLNQKTNLLNTELKTLKNSRLPSVSLYGAYNEVGFGYDKAPNQFLNFYPTSFAGLQITVPLFNGTVTKRKINRKKIELTNSELRLSLLTEKNDIEILNASRQRDVALKNITNTSEQINLARSLYEHTVLQQEQGLANITDVLMADKNLKEAQQNNIAAIVNYLKADLELKKLTGNIDTSSAKITKLPFGMNHAKVVESLAKMVDKGQIVDYTDKSKADVNIVVNFKRAAMKNKTGEFAARKLKLSAGVTERIIVLDAKESKAVVEYDDAAKFITDYTNWRLSFFPARYRRLIQLNDNEISRLNDIVLAIDNDLGGQAKNIKNKGDLITFIESIGVIDIEYISSLPIYRFTEEEYDKAKNRIDELQTQNKDYNDIIDDIDRQKSIYIEELKEVKRKFAK